MSHPADRLPPAAKAVRLALLKEGELTRSRLMEISLLPPRTTDHGLQDLARVGLLDQRYATDGDARVKLFSLSGDPAQD